MIQQHAKRCSRSLVLLSSSFLEDHTSVQSCNLWLVGLPAQRQLMCPGRSTRISFFILHPIWHWHYPASLSFPRPRGTEVLWILLLFYLASLLVNPLLLHKISVGVGEASVIGQCSQTLLLQSGRCGVTLVSGKAINYPRVICKHIKMMSATAQLHSLSLA